MQGVKRIKKLSMFFIGALILHILTAYSVTTPGSLAKGVIQLPNGWKIAPAGKHLPLDDLPMEMVESFDGRYLVVTNNGYSKPVLDVIDLQRSYVAARVAVENAWLGLVWSPDGKTLYSSAGGANAIDVFKFSEGALTKAASFRVPNRAAGSFVGGLAISGDGGRIYGVHILGNTVFSLDTAKGTVLQTVPLDAEPYTCILSADGKNLFVSLWGGSRVLELDPQSLQTRRTIAVGEHPSSMVLSPDGMRLFVACANSNNVWVINLKSGVAQEQISVALYPQSPVGSTPSALAISADGKELLVANSDNNAVAVINVGKQERSKVAGFIPTGWYPTAVRYSRDGKRIFILSGKGMTSTSNPRGPDEPNYIGQLLLGTLSVLARPNQMELQEFTRKVYALTPYSDSFRLTPPRAPAASPVPRRVGQVSPIKHVFYIIRENRTYDQVFGDMPKGNGDPNLCLFGEEVTPNAHALASQFVLLDNFYVDAEVSADGHAFSTGAYANDFIEKTWPMNYASRGALYLTEGGGRMRNDYGNIAAPADGYLWDAARRKNVSVRSYGEFAHWKGQEEEDTEHGKELEAGVPGLKDRIDLDYPAWDLSIPDNVRVDAWLKEFRQFEKDGKLPRLNIFHLPNDHTAGTRPRYPTPRAMVAENDFALGRIVEAISKSRYWETSAIFVLEDDAQDGPDHVDAHRSVALVISPYTKREAVDSTMYSTSGMLRTIELILGLEPMSQYDAAATPLYGSFQMKPNYTPYQHREAQISIQEMNADSDYGAADSLAIDFRDPDRIPMQRMNEILWKSIKGAASVMPPPVRAAFITTDD
jgi:YVTN family beta-propeller protein